MSGIGVPGSPDGPGLEPEVVGELVVMFRASGPPNVKWPRIAGRSHREVVGEAIETLRLLLDDDLLDKIDGNPPREPPS